MQYLSRKICIIYYPYMDYLLPKLLKSNRTSPSYFKRCNYIKHEVSKRIQPNLAKNIPNLVK